MISFLRIKYRAHTTIADRSLRFKILLSSGTQIVGQILGALLAVITLKLITSSLGLKDYGFYATALAFVSTFSLLTDLGLSAITAREIARRPTAAADIIGHNMGLRIALCLVVIPIAIGLSFLVYPHSTGSLRVSIAILSIYLVFDAVRAVSMSYFTAQVRNDIAALIGLFQQLLLFILSVIVSICSGGIYYFIAIFVISNAASALLGISVTSKYVDIRPKVNFAKWSANIKLSISLGIILIANILYLKIDMLLLSILKGSNEVGIYGIAYSLILTFLTLPGILMSSLIPSMATSKSIPELKNIVEKALCYMAIFAGMLVAGGFAVRGSLVIVISSQEFRQAATPFAILCFATAFSYLNNVFGFASVAINKHHKLIYVSVGTLILNVLLNLYLIPRYSTEGAAWATVVCEFIAFILVYNVFKHESKVNINMLHYTYKPIISCLGTIIFIILCSQFWNNQNPLVNSLVNGIISLLSFVLILGVLGGLPNEVSAMTKKVILKIRS